MRALFIKLGGSLITDKSKPMQANHQAIQQVSQELAHVYKADPDTRLFIGNGAGSYGHHMVHKTGWKDDRRNMQSVALVRQATAELNELVLDQLLINEVPAVSLPAASFMEHMSSGLQSTPQTLFDYASLGAAISVYGDVMYDQQAGTSIASTEMILEELARQWTKAGHEVDAFIYCTSVDGVLDAKKQVIPDLSETTTGDFITGSEHQDVTGGMKQKVEAGFANLAYTDHVYIINGLKQGELTKAVAHQAVGTRLVTG